MEGAQGIMEGAQGEVNRWEISTGIWREKQL